MQLMARTLDGAYHPLFHVSSRTASESSARYLLSMPRSLARDLIRIVVTTAVVFSPLVGQTPRSNAWVTAYAGLAPSIDGAAVLGLELRGPEFGRAAPTFTASRWWFGVGCDAIVGAPCDDQGWAVDLGTNVRFTPRPRAWQAFGSARIGRLFYDDLERGVWNSSLGVGIAWTGRDRVGVQAELRYHALTGAGSRDRPYSPRTQDYLVVQAGIHFRP